MIPYPSDSFAEFAFRIALARPIDDGGFDSLGIFANVYGLLPLKLFI